MGLRLLVIKVVGCECPPVKLEDEDVPVGMALDPEKEERTMIEMGAVPPPLLLLLLLLLLPLLMWLATEPEPVR